MILISFAQIHVRKKIGQLHLTSSVQPPDAYEKSLLPPKAFPVRGQKFPVRILGKTVRMEPKIPAKQPFSVGAGAGAFRKFSEIPCKIPA
ncbi:hypothetical protein [Sphingorhabdus contaminans]|uniref:hypothetical protein n=1 Tax=Sphingorhabdus contaminans TaxID=1343899 RepID=UPI003D2C625A